MMSFPIKISSSNNVEEVSLEDFLKLTESWGTYVGLYIDKINDDFKSKNISNIYLSYKDVVAIIDGMMIESISDVLISHCLIMYRSFNILPFLFSYNVKIRNIHDIYMSERVMTLGSESTMLSMDSIASKYNAIKGSDTDEHGYLRFYNDIFDSQMKKAKENECEKAVMFENMFAPVLAYISWCGFKLDEDKWNEIITKNSELNIKAKETLDNIIFKNFPNEKELCTIDRQGDLFEGFVDKKKCHINWRNSEKVSLFISKYITGNKSVEDDFSKSYEDFLKTESSCKMYGKNYISSINRSSGRIHPIYRQMSDEGRISSPIKVKNKYGGDIFTASAMNLPKEYKTAIIPENGNCFVISDWKACQISILADLAYDTRMLSIINGGGDIHEYVGNMYNISRDEGKNVNFMIVYGGSDYGLSKKLGISVEAAGNMIKKYAKEFPLTARYVKGCLESILTNRYIPMYSLYGYKQEIPDYDKLNMIKSMFSPRFWKSYQKIKNNPNDIIVKDVKYFMKRKEELYRSYVNSKIQNVESVMLKSAAILLYNHIVKNDYFGIVKMVLLIHDSIVIECPEDMKEYMMDKMKKAMTKANNNICPKVKIGIHEQESKFLL